MFNPYEGKQHYNYLKRVRSQGVIDRQKTAYNSQNSEKNNVTKKNILIKNQINLTQQININKSSQESFYNSLNCISKSQVKTSNKTRLSEEIFKYDIKQLNRQQKRAPFKVNQSKSSTKLSTKIKQDDSSDITSTQQSSFQQIEYVNSEYQLNDSHLFNKQRKVQFSEKLIQSPLTHKKMTFKQKRQQLQRRQIKTPSILKNKNNNKILDQSIYSETQKSYSIQNSFAVHKKGPINKLNSSSGNEITKQKYFKIIQKLKLQNSTKNYGQKQKPKNVNFIQNHQNAAIKHKNKTQKNTSINSLSYKNYHIQSSQIDYSGYNVSAKAYKIKSSKQEQKSSINISKYTDQIFPPVYSSIFRIIASKKPSSEHQRNQKKTHNQIQWKRISQLYQSKRTMIYNNITQKTTQIRIHKSQNQQNSLYFSDNVIGSFNAIKNNRILLQKIFGDQEDLNIYGAYLLNIYVDNNWKSVIIDDYVPVVKIQTQEIIQGEKHVFYRYQPVFLNISIIHQSQQQIDSQNQILYLWPFLLQKAYAAYYSCYDALNYGNVIDFTSQITSVPYQILKFPKLSSNKINTQSSQQYEEEFKAKTQKLMCLLNQKSIVAIGFSDYDLPFVPLHYENCNHSFLNLKQQMLSYYDPLSNYEAVRISFNQVGKLFTRIYIYNCKNYNFTTSCQVFPYKNKEDNKKLQIEENMTIVQSISLRKFTLKQPTLGNISIRQKDNRYLMKSDLSYIWLRVILLMKQLDGQYRWINGKYSNKKSIIFNYNNQQLQKGQYYILIMPEWKQANNRQITVIFDSDNQFAKFQRKIINPTQKIIERGCMDIAQRKGKLNQLNKSICSYTLVLQKVGIIIETICNERPKGQVTIMRSINGLKARCKIIPFNDQFYFIEQKTQNKNENNQSLTYDPSKQKSQKIYKLKSQIEIDIPSLQNFSVVLKMIGGIDRRFFKAFNFG